MYENFHITFSAEDSIYYDSKVDLDETVFELSMNFRINYKPFHSLSLIDTIGDWSCSLPHCLLDQN